MSLGRLASKRLEPGKSRLHAIVPLEATSAEIASVRNGMGRRDDAFSGIADELANRFPESWIALGLPLAVPGDSGLPADGTTAVCDTEVYIVRPIDAGEGALTMSLRNADPSFNYVFAVLDGVSADTADRCPTQGVEAGQYAVRALGVGAYDGEGFIIAEFE